MPQKSKQEMGHAEHKKSFIKDSRFVCKPLDSLNEIMLFLENPPPWRTLCQELTPHSDFLIRNDDIHQNSEYQTLERPQSFCHYDPDSDDVERHEAKTLPKTLVCHDMADGYHDDCIIDGTTNSDAYTFYNWAGIDIFCYFSHHLITIPPVGWINVGHAHGVKVIGTIITEWADGVAFWDAVLDSEVQYQNVASALVAIAKTLKFDGYLLNVENKVGKPEVLLAFVRYFQRLLHEELPHATLLWYDSVTVRGNLSWQNKLNDKNMAFFEACDGLFTNYSWTPEDVPASAELAGARVTDLYIGIDVFGRNFYGGGQFNTQEAIKVVHAAGCSIALFAPAWTHEALSLDREDHNHVAMGDDLDLAGTWQLRDRAFWGSIWPYLNTRVPCHIPFATSFCRGQGKKRWLYGETLCPSPWFNLRHQQYQPNSAHGPHGYMLTRVENLATVKDEVHYKDKKGIIRIRASFMQVRADILAVNREALPTTSVQEALQLDRSSTTHSRTEPQGHGSKVDALKNMFKPKQKTSEAEGADASTPREPSEQTGEQATVNLSLSRKQARRYGLARVPDERQCLEPHYGDAFSGGACLMVHPSDHLCPEHRFTRLLHCDFPCEEGLIFCVVTKTVQGYPDQTLNVKLYMRNAADEDLMVVLTGRALNMASALGAASRGIAHVYPLPTTQEHVLRALRTYLLLTQPGFYVPIDNAFGWTVRYFEVSVPGSRITSINLRTSAPTGPILLGHLAIWKKTSDTSFDVPVAFQSSAEPGH
ncbi:hypothetical protein PYW07_017471 [Mythimna separata]|uniref:Cytosolic endo-beta-N-acetylglucosaminidase TIM barrel domain-containing protein n=1 Tax=Mythimna separata TaxID=271217 RepID=A0AAD7YXA1_MYTSE|nr:hypothetical protein PYW07_017471 [Mythimna separata]